MNILTKHSFLVVLLVTLHVARIRPLYARQSDKKTMALQQQHNSLENSLEQLQLLHRWKNFEIKKVEFIKKSLTYQVTNLEFWDETTISLTYCVRHFPSTCILDAYTLQKKSAPHRSIPKKIVYRPLYNEFPISKTGNKPPSNVLAEIPYEYSGNLFAVNEKGTLGITEYKNKLTLFSLAPFSLCSELATNISDEIRCIDMNYSGTCIGILLKNNILVTLTACHEFTLDTQKPGLKKLYDVQITFHNSLQKP